MAEGKRGENKLERRLPRLRPSHLEDGSVCNQVVDGYRGPHWCFEVFTRPLGRYENVHALRYNALDVLSEQPGKTAFNPYPFDGDQRRRSGLGIVLKDDVFENAARAREICPMKSADFHPAEALFPPVPSPPRLG